MNMEQIVEIGIVARHLSTVVDGLEKLGITGWEYGEFDSRFLPESRINGTEDYFIMKSASVKIGALALEVIEPQSPGFFADFLKEHGTGIHHIAFKTKENYKSFVEEYVENGGKLAMEMSVMKTSPVLGYLDTLKELGFYVELHNDQEPEE